MVAEPAITQAKSASKRKRIACSGTCSGGVTCPLPDSPMGRSAFQHLAFRVLICCGFAYARAAVIAPQFNVTSLDGRLTIELDSSTGLINRIYTRSSNTSSYVASDAAGGSVLQGCAIVPGSLAIVPSAQNLGVQRSLFCADGEGGTNNSFIVDITDTFTPMAASVQWTTSYLVDEGVPVRSGVPVCILSRFLLYGN